MAILKQIYIYPVKSMPGIEVDTAYVEKTGLKGDRNWMLVDEHNRFISLREQPSLVNFQCKLSGDDLIIAHEGDSLQVRDKDYSNPISARIWADTVRVQQAIPSVSDWLSIRLGQKVGLVRRRNETVRSKLKNNGQVSLADQWPYLVLSQQSIEDLNSRLGKNISIKNFRPNLVVSVKDAYEEDHWLEFSVGNQKFNGIGTCGRCNVVDINFKTGEQEGNVLRTIGSYRKEGQKIPMGLHAVAEGDGTIKVGMEIQIHAIRR